MRYLILLLLCWGLTGCSNPSDPNPDKPKYQRTLVDCDECKGKGKVTYDGSVPGLTKGTWDCPMCNGTGHLYEEKLVP